MAIEQVTIPERQVDFIRQMIADGRFGDISEVVRAGVLLLEERVAQEEQRKVTLRALLDEAFAAGLSDRTPQEIWAAAEARYLSGNA